MKFAFAPEVVHLQSGRDLADVALVEAGARPVLGIDDSQVAVRAAQRRADDLGAPCWLSRSSASRRQSSR